jgi:beta-glucanase (GH16 family)
MWNWEGLGEWSFCWLFFITPTFIRTSCRNGEFQMTTTSPNNLYTSNSQLYILPTLTSDAIGTAAIFDKGSYTLDGCTTTSTNKTACTATSSAAKGAVINPVMSARISTQGKVNIQYGKVEVRAKLPRGDWLWPAIWMLPESETYGAWPLSGEIDVRPFLSLTLRHLTRPSLLTLQIMEARGNRPGYAGQGSNFVRSTLNYGPLAGLMTQIYGWYSEKRGGFDQGFRTYGMEWDEQFMRFYTDSRVHAMLDLRVGGKGEGFWARGK